MEDNHDADHGHEDEELVSVSGLWALTFKFHAQLTVDMQPSMHVRSSLHGYSVLAIDALASNNT